MSISRVLEDEQIEIEGDDDASSALNLSSIISSPSSSIIEPSSTPKKKLKMISIMAWSFIQEKHPDLNSKAFDRFDGGNSSIVQRQAKAYSVQLNCQMTLHEIGDLFFLKVYFDKR